jgi:hypothetical protein
MIAIWPAGPPKLIIPSFSQNQNASRSVGVDARVSALVSAADAGGPSERSVLLASLAIAADSDMNRATAVAQLR